MVEKALKSYMHERIINLSDQTDIKITLTETDKIQTHMTHCEDTNIDFVN